MTVEVSGKTLTQIKKVIKYSSKRPEAQQQCYKRSRKQFQIVMTMTLSKLIYLF